MDEKTLTFGDIEIKKQRLYHCRSRIRRFKY